MGVFYHKKPFVVTLDKERALEFDLSRFFSSRETKWFKD